MAGVVDTNILLYAVNSDAAEHGRARDFLTSAGNSEARWFLTEDIVYEFLRVSTHAAVFPRPLRWTEALAFVDALLSGPCFDLLAAGPRHWTHLREILESVDHPAGNLMFDARTATIMRDHGVRRVYTTDVDFRRFASVETVMPLRGDG